MTEMSTFAVDLKNIHEVFKHAQKKVLKLSCVQWTLPCPSFLDLLKSKG